MRGVTTVGDYAFKGYDTLSKIALPSTLMSIGDETFLGCDTLSKIVLPSTLISIGDNTFLGCSGVKELTLKGSMPEGLDIFIFSGHMIDYLVGHEPTEEKRLRDKGESLIPMTIYYTGDTYDEYISSYPYWSDYGVNWVKQ